MFWTNIKPYITIGGQGTRLRNITKNDKHNLYYLNSTIIDHIKSLVPNCGVIGTKKTRNRKETLLQIPEHNNILIIDCDIIPYNINLLDIDISLDNVYTFISLKNKYSSVIVENDHVVKVDEHNNISNIKCSGVYFCKNLRNTIDRMTNDDSIISGMVGAKVIMENTFKKLGDIEDYYESIGIC